MMPTEKAVFVANVDSVPVLHQHLELSSRLLQCFLHLSSPLLLRESVYFKLIEQDASGGSYNQNIKLIAECLPSRKCLQIRNAISEATATWRNYRVYPGSSLYAGESLVGCNSENNVVFQIK